MENRFLWIMDFNGKSFYNDNGF